jgi:adenosine deaminase
MNAFRVTPLADPDLEVKLRRVPKAELHIHFEGAMRWSTIRELHPEGRDFPETPSWCGRPFSDFTDFRQAIRDHVIPVTGTPETLERHTFEVIEDLAVQNVRYAEIIVSHEAHTLRGLADEAIWVAIATGRARATDRYPIDVRLILGLARHSGPESVFARLESIAKFGIARGWLDGVDLQGDERLGDHRAFVDAYRRAADLGLKLRAHAGEICGPTNVRDAVVLSGVTQIAHGVRACEDAALVAELAARGVFLHVCPTSNLMLGCAESYDRHPLRTLAAAGVRCTVNSDDPLLFGSEVLNEYRVVLRDMGFSVAELAEFVKNGFRASLMDHARVEAFCAEVDTVLDTTP